MMGRSRRLRTRVSVLVALGVLVASGASAQFFDEALRELSLAPDPLARSPRLVAMGGLHYVLQDPHRRIDLWEFTGNTSGLLDSDSLSRLELHPGTQSASDARDLPTTGTLARERQGFAMREVRLGYELWRRSASRTTAFGLTGDYSTLRTDRPSSADLELRRQFSVPNTMGVLSGTLPFFMPDRVRYGLHVAHRYEVDDDIYLTIVRNDAGEFIDKDGGRVPPPDFFTPDHRAVRSIGGGASVSARVVSGANVGAGIDYLANAIESRNDGDRYSTEILEDRPILLYHLDGVVRGKLGESVQIENGLRYEDWTSDSDQRWVFTLSAGTGAVPINGRGGYGNRDEKGSGVREWLRLTTGSLQLGGGLNWSRREIGFDPTPMTDQRSFNYFRNFLYNKVGLDSLVLPDSLIPNSSEQEAIEFGLGGAWSLPYRDATMGVEFHSGNTTYDDVVAGTGPESRTWDVRGGLDGRINPVLRGQFGYRYRTTDLDENTEQNEFVSHTVSAGLTLAPATTTWQIDFGYSIEIRQTDFDDISGFRGNAQRGLLRLRWKL
jgi:hypothetical protein